MFFHTLRRYFVPRLLKFLILFNLGSMPEFSSSGFDVDGMFFVSIFQPSWTSSASGWDDHTCNHCQLDARNSRRREQRWRRRNLVVVVSRFIVDIFAVASLPQRLLGQYFMLKMDTT